MKSLHESLLDPDFDFNFSDCAVKLSKLFSSSKCQHVNNPPIQAKLLYNFPIQDKLYDIFAKYAKKISVSTARKKQNVVICRLLNPYSALYREDYKVIEMYIKMEGKVFHVQKFVRTDEWTYGISYNKYIQEVQYTSSGGKWEYYEFPKDVIDIIQREFEYFNWLQI